MVAVAIIGSAVLGVGGAMMSSGAQSSAAQTQADSANRASDLANQRYEQSRQDLMPYNTAGQGGLNQLTSQMGALTAPFSMTQAQLEATPGYQFNLAQGLKSVNNAMGARGLLNSGAVMKGASQYATGLADSTYQSQFNMDQANKTNAYNKLMGLSQLGENAAAQTGAYGMQNAQMVGNNMIGAGNALAAGQVGSANAWANGLSGVGNSLVASQMYGGMNGGGIFGGGGGGGMSGSQFASQYGTGGSAYSGLGL